MPEVNPLLLGVLPGGLAVAFSRRHQRLGDMLSGSVVVERRSLPVQQPGDVERVDAA